MQIPSPAIVTRQAVRRLPKGWLLALCVVYAFMGVVGRDPWKSNDLTSFGYMLSLQNGISDWLNLRMAGQSPELDALAPYWLGVWAMNLLPFLSADLAARLFYALLNLTGMYCLWQGIYHLARNPQAQPVAFAFGGEASPKDYAHAMADAGLLAYIASLGLALPSHEVTPMAMQLQCICIIFASAASLAFHPRVGLVGVVLGGWLLTLSGAPTLATCLLAGTIYLWGMNPQSHKREVFVMTLGLVSVLGLNHALDLWQWRVTGWAEIIDHGRETMELMVWFLWPTWPMALWTLWKWGKHWRQQVWTQHLTLPIFFLMVTWIASVITSNRDRTLLLALPSLAALAAFALPTFNRAAAALVDWFTLVFFTSGALAIWVVWVSLQTGVPAQPAVNVGRLVPGYVDEFNPLTFALALAASWAWVLVIRWRIGRHPSAIWKSLVLPASGASLCWLLLMTLWLPILDQALSYRVWAEQIHQQLHQPTCVQYQFLERHQFAGLTHHGAFKLVSDQTENTTCPWLVNKSGYRGSTDKPLDARTWQWVMTIQRPGDKSDKLDIYQRRP